MASYFHTFCCQVNSSGIVYPHASPTIQQIIIYAVLHTATINKYNGLGLHTTRLLCYTRISPLHVHEDCWYYRWFPKLPHLRPFGLLLTEPSISPRTSTAVFESDNLSTTTCSYIRPVSYITSLLCVRLYQSIPCLDPMRSSCLSTSCLLALH